MMYRCLWILGVACVWMVLPCDRGWAEEMQVNTYTTNHQRWPAVTLAPNGSDNSDDSVQGQFYGADGRRLAGEFQVNALTSGDQGYPAVALASDGNLIVVWHSDVSSGTDTDFTSIQRTSVGLVFVDGFESGDVSAWSSSLP